MGGKKKQQGKRGPSSQPKIVTGSPALKPSGDAIKSPQGKGPSDLKEGPSVEELFGRLKSAVNKEEFSRVVKTSNESE